MRLGLTVIGVAALAAAIQGAIALSLGLNRIAMLALATASMFVSLCGGALLVRRSAIRPSSPEQADDQVRRWRHDLRGDLTPLLLEAERLAQSDNPSIARAGERIAAGIDRVNARVALLGRKDG